MQFVGVDISKRKFHAALLINGKVEKKTSDNSEPGIKGFIDWLARHTEEPSHVCMEATNTYWEALARALVEAGHQVSVENPKLIHNFAKSLNLRSKTDAVDAVLIARYVDALRPAPWQPPSTAQYELKQLLRRREELVKALTQEQNRLKAGCLHPREQQSLERHIAWMEAELADIERETRQHVRNHTELDNQTQLLRSLPGVGEVTSWTMIARLKPAEAYSSAKQVAAFVGVTPKERSSGTSVKGKARMCKMGDPELRKLLFLAARKARKKDEAAKAFADRLEKAGKPKMVIFGALMRKLLHAAYGILKSGTPYNPARAFQAA